MHLQASAFRSLVLLSGAAWASALCGHAAAQCTLTYADPIRTTGLVDVGDSVPADFDGDGMPDLVQVRRTGLGVFILWGLGNGSFEPPQQIFPGSAGQVAVGDFDEDGRPDIVAKDFTSPPSLRIILSRPGRTFLAMPNAPLPGAVNFIDVAVGDINGDGHLDAAAFSRSLPAIHMAFGNGTGVLAAQTATPLSFNVSEVSQAFAVTDLDGDGAAEIIAAGTTGSNGGTTRIYTGRWVQAGSPLDGTDRMDLPFQIDDLCIADLNEDGRGDVIAAFASSAPSRGVAVFLGNSEAKVDPPVLYPEGSGLGLAITAADMNNDGHTDVLCTNPGFRLWLGDGTGNLAFEDIHFFDVGPTTLAAGDFDHDGRTDVSHTSDGATSSTTDVVLNSGPLPFIRPLQNQFNTCPTADFDVRVFTPRLIDSPPSWQYFDDRDWVTLPEGGDIRNLAGEFFGTGNNVSTNTLRVTVAPTCCVNALTVVRCVIEDNCGTATSPPIHLVLCRPDTNCDGFLDFFDYDDFVTLYTEGGNGADFNQDGFLDFFDYDAFVESFETGC